MAVIRTSTATNSNKAYTNWPEGTFLARLSKITATKDKKTGVPLYNFQWRMVSPQDLGLDPQLKALFEAGEPRLVREQSAVAADTNLGALFDRISIAVEDRGRGPEAHWTIRRLGGFIPTDNVFADDEHPDFAANKTYDAELDEDFDTALASVTEVDEEEYRHTDLNKLAPHLVGQLAVIRTKLTPDKTRRDEQTSLPIMWTNIVEYKPAHSWPVEDLPEFAPQTVPAGALSEVPTGAALESYA